MYQRIINICMLCPGKCLPLIEEVARADGFSVRVVEGVPDADIILFRDENKEDVCGEIRAVCEKKRSDAFLVVVTERPETLADVYGDVYDIWELPLSDRYLKFLVSSLIKRRIEFMEQRRTEMYLDVLIDSTPSLVWFKDKNGLHEKVNNAFCETVGKTKEDIFGKPHSYIWGVPTDDPACVASDNRAMESGKTVITEEHIDSKDGVRILTSYKSPLYDFDGSVMGTVGVALDITKERKFEEEILSKNRMFESIFATIDCGLMWHSLDGKEVFFINKTALQILGYETCDALMADGFDLIAQTVADEDKPILREKIRSLQRPGDTTNVEYRVNRPNGEVTHVLGNIRLSLVQGKPIIQRYLLDITEQKKKSKLQTALVQVLASSYSVVCYFDINTGKGTVQHINDCPKKKLSSVFDEEYLDYDKTLKVYCESCVVDEDKECFLRSTSRERVQRELAEKSTYIVNYRVCCENEEKYFRIKAVRVGSDVISHGIVVGIRNVDEEIRAEMENKALLENALAQANRASKAKSVFLSNMSHDIRTPMNAIVGFTTLALSHLDRRELVEDYLEKIMISGRHLLSLINDVLDMSRIESGKIHLEESSCTLPEILHGVFNMIRPDVQKKQMELKTDISNIRHESIVCDKLRLNQVLLNLLSNAVKYTPAGGKISVKASEPSANEEENKAAYEFVISDTGMGMSEEFVKHIFEPFEREHNTTASGIQGTGLGMAITKNIVDMMNGNITIDSKPNKGTTVTVRFEFEIIPKEVTDGDISKYHGLRALVVDDDFNTCDCVTDMLSELGMRAEWTLSGKEAELRSRQAVTRGDSYDLFVIDCFLPDLNGIELVRRLRREAERNVPVIIITAYDYADFEAEAREEGISTFCSKPLFMSELKTCLETLFAEPAQDGVLRSGRILLAEDNDLNREIAYTLLSEAGFDVETAENGEQAVEMIKTAPAEHFDIILMDVQMPVMNGYEATRAIRALEGDRAKIPILAMTANAFEEDKREALACGMNGHLAKPINVDEMLKTLDKLMEKQEVKK